MDSDALSHVDSDTLSHADSDTLSHVDSDTLSHMEKQLWQAFATGAPVEAGGQEVRASVIARLLLRPEGGGSVSAVNLEDAVITGELQLSFATVAHPLMLTRCELRVRPDFYWARVNFVSLRDCRMPGLAASNIQVERHLQLTGSTFDGDVKLGGARISGGLLLDGVSLQSLAAHRVQTGGDLILNRAKASGTVSMYMGSVGGNLELDEAELSVPGGLALEASSMTVAGGCYGRRATIAGEVTLRHSRIQGAVTFSASTLDNPGAMAFRADRADIEGGLWMLHPFNARGRLTLVGARIGRILTLTGAQLDSLDATGTHVDGGIGAMRLRADGAVVLSDLHVTGPLRLSGAKLGGSLLADGLRAESIVDCCEGFTADGHISFGGARLSGTLCFDRSVLNSLACWRLEAPELSLRWDEAPKGLVDLRFARVGVLRDNPGVRPSQVHLDGLTYEAIEPVLDISQRLRLLASDPDGYRPQPYEQLAAVCRRLGHDDEARAVLIAKQRRRTAGAARVVRWWGRLQDFTVGYGYRPLRAAAWLLLALTIGSVVFGLNPPPRVDPDRHVAFQPVIYTLDVLLPIVEFGQQATFEPADWTRWLMFALMATGWILATTVAAGVARSLTPSSP